MIFKPVASKQKSLNLVPSLLFHPSTITVNRRAKVMDITICWMDKDNEESMTVVGVFKTGLQLDVVDFCL